MKKRFIPVKPDILKRAFITNKKACLTTKSNNTLNTIDWALKVKEIILYSQDFAKIYFTDRDQSRIIYNPRIKQAKFSSTLSLAFFKKSQNTKSTTGQKQPQIRMPLQPVEKFYTEYIACSLIIIILLLNLRNRLY